DGRPGYEAIRVRYQVKSPASRQQLVELCDYVQRTSPVLDIIANRVPVTVDLVA
ncbi:MAG: OsmC family protein, partial [Chloroflexi bacterium]|nr:OsmC family protein [Chloroflexota bacterium]